VNGYLTKADDAPALLAKVKALLPIENE